MNALFATFAAATVSADADVSGIAHELCAIARSAELKTEYAALVAAEIAAEDAGGAAWVAAYAAKDAWLARTECERVSMFGRSGFWS